MQICRAPIRVLCKAKDFYVKSMLEFAGSGRVGYGSIGGAAVQLPKSFSVNSSRAVEDQEFKEHLQLLSAKGISEVETYLPCRQGVFDTHKSKTSEEHSAHNVEVSPLTMFLLVFTRLVIFIPKSQQQYSIKSALDSQRSIKSTMIRSKANEVSKLVQMTRAPIRVMFKARDFYVKSMLKFAGSGKVGCGGIGGGTA
ncbi:hypothetical protein GH714_031034 [Hevea brasiliensis]|uniref:Uncharacterized protein n=1 Tax=Hevea brasiliensis TaxID=3981 RepID=A0A6A6N9D9_HEVBR|nr:hypothetical protein GH714_031034 [Hevea brasiliensis]